MTAAEFERLPVPKRLFTARTMTGMTVAEVAAVPVRAYEAGQHMTCDSVKIAVTAMYRMYLPSLFF